MSGVKHTPGPWISSGVYIDSDFGMVGHANFSADLLSGCPKANARLIASAPDLLDALTVLRDNIVHAWPHMASLGPIQNASAAIARARGEQDGGA